MNFSLLTTYTRSLLPADFSEAVFTCAHFQKVTQIASLGNFHYITERIPSLMYFWLLMTYVLRIWFMQIFARPKKTHEPSTRCIDFDSIAILLRMIQKYCSNFFTKCIKFSCDKKAKFCS